MNPQQRNPSPQEEDPWEQLAENLFGIAYGKEHASTEPREVAPEAVVPEPVTEAAGTAEESVGFTEEEADEYTSEPAETPIVAAEPPMVTEPPVPAASPQDAYWDALANWSWDEQGGGAARGAASRDVERPQTGESRPPRREGGGRPQRDRRERHGAGSDRPSRGPQQESKPPSHRPPASPARPSVPRPTEEDTFGAGLFGEAPRWEEPVVEAPAPHTSDAESVDADFFEEDETEEAVPTAPAETGRERFEGEEDSSGDRPRRRRRRRRRRSRGPETGPAAAQPGPVASGAEPDWSDEESDAAGESDLGERAPPARPTEPESRRPSGRDRGDRQQRHPPAEDFAEVAWEDEEPIVSQTEERSEPFADDAEEDDDGGEQAVSYANIPTWEEAISYLLHPEQVQSDTPSSGSGGGPRAGSSGSEGRRPNRYYGKGKGRR